MDSLSRALLESIVSLPTMSFHEGAVATFVRWYAAFAGLSVKEDRAGNILVSYRGGGGGDLTFAAHMDHPGFEVIGARGNKAKVALWGSVRPGTFAGSRVRVHTAAGIVMGRIGRKALPGKHEGRLTFELKAEGPVEKDDFGAFDVTPFRMSGDRINALACDNLVSVAVVLDLMTRFARGNARVNVSGLFTRCEEAGFLGAFAAMESGLIPRRPPLIVVECSSAKGGGVKIAGGPVIRAGDLASTFDPEVEVWLSDVASSLVPGPESRVPNSGFRFQRALLQGGRCEACVYVAEGYRVGGVALALGNYHNHGARGYAAEHVSAGDYDKLLALMAALSHRPMGKGRMRARVAPIRKHYLGLKKKLVGSR